MPLLPWPDLAARSNAAVEAQLAVATDEAPPGIPEDGSHMKAMEAQLAVAQAAVPRQSRGSNAAAAGAAATPRQHCRGSNAAAAA